MTSTPCQGEALDHLVAPWAAKIARSSGTTVEAILTHAENVRAAVQELAPHGRKARQLLAQRSGLSRPMLSKLETIGRHAEPLRHRAGFLPPSVSALYALARKSSPGFERALMMDLRGKSSAEIKALFAPPAAPKRRRKLMTVLVPPNLNDAARRVLIADIEAALVRISENRRVDVEASLPANGPQRQDERPAAPGDEDAAMSDASHEARDLQPHEPDKVALGGVRADARDGWTQLETDQRLIRERIERLEKQFSSGRPQSDRQRAPPA